MQTHQQYVDAYHAAMANERALWDKIKDKQPGRPDFDRAMWDRWMEAVKQTTAASKALREAFADDSKLGDLT